jgi:hypothetical protein
MIEDVWVARDKARLFCSIEEYRVTEDVLPRVEAMRAKMDIGAEWQQREAA